MKDTLDNVETGSYNLQGTKFLFTEGTGQIDVKLISGGDTRTFRLSKGKGVDFSPNRFNSVEILNISGAAQTVEFEVHDKEVFTQPPSTITTKTAPNSFCNDAADQDLLAAASAVIAEKAGRLKLTVYALPGNAGYLRVGPAAAAGRGYPLSPGGSFTFTTDKAITVYAEEAGSFGYIEETL